MPAIDRGIDALNEKVGRATALLAIPLIGVVVYEVFMRYVFNAPTLWAFEMTTFIYGVHFVLGASYTLKVDGHVAVDVFEARLRPRWRARLRILTYLVLFLPSVLVMAVGAVIYARDSWANWERNSTSWAPALYPYKTLMAIGFVLLLLQGVSKLVADLRLARAERPAEAAAGAMDATGDAR